MDIETCQVHLNSKYADGYVDNNNSNCIFNLPILEIPSQHTAYLSVQHATIPYSFYNINSSNNTLYLQEITVDAYGAQTGVINTYIYISVGNYNAYQLATYLGTIFPSNRITVAYDNIKNKYTFTNSTYNFKFLNAYSTCLDLLGLSTNDLYNTSYVKILTAPFQINLSPVSCICISTNLETGSINNNFKYQSNILCSIPVNNNPFSLIEYKNTSNFKVNLHTNIFNSINIKLTDQYGNPIDLNNKYFNITLQLDIVNFVE